MGATMQIFAYGSLLNEQSLRKTVPSASGIFPARVLGFRRVFNLASHYRFCSRSGDPVCVLNVEATEPSVRMNGMCFEVAEDSFASLRSREQIYRMHEVDVHDYASGTIRGRAALFWATEHEDYCYLADSLEQKHYLDLCLSGCRVYGRGFEQEFRRTTGFRGIESQCDIERIWNGDY